MQLQEGIDDSYSVIKLQKYLIYLRDILDIEKNVFNDTLRGSLSELGSIDKRSLNAVNACIINLISQISIAKNNVDDVIRNSGFT